MESIPLHVATEEEMEQAAYVVCMRADHPSLFVDDEFGTCSHCGAAVMFRPYMPKRPPRICLPCLMDTVNGGRA